MAKRDTKCINLSFNERAAIWSALNSRKHAIIKAGMARQDASYLKMIKKLEKKFKR